MIGLGSDKNNFVHEDFGAGIILEIKSVCKKWRWGLGLWQASIAFLQDRK